MQTQMNQQTIAATLLAVALMVGVSACGQSNSAQTPPADTTVASPTAASPASEQPGNSSTLSPAQKAERAAKREAVRKQITAILTPDQAEQFQTKVQGGEKMRQALRELNLTADQKTKVHDILKAAYPHQQGSQSPQKG